jgi:predicted neutral ceramidase superfamily lipid hydrolase
MEKLYEKISKRNKKETTDQEFEVYTSDDFNDNVFRGYSQVPKIKKESDIIKDIKLGVDYRTDEKTSVQIGIREGNEYIHSVKNGTILDNIKYLPTYE